MKSIRKNWLKYLLQFGTLALIIGFLTKVFGNSEANPEAYCPMGGLETLATYLVRGSLACSMTMTQIAMGGLLAIGVILFGKLFCGYVCPIGLVNELIVKLRRALKIKKFVISQGSVADKVLRVVKYGMLFWIFYTTLSTSELFCKKFDPYYAVATGFQGEIILWMSLTSIGVLLLGSLLVDMFWCKYICPLGAISNTFKYSIWTVGLIVVYAILTMLGVNIPWVVLLAIGCVMGYLLEILVRKPKLNPQILKVCRDTEKCNNCGLCEKRCPYHVNITDFTKVAAPDCNLCGECLNACNKEALTITKKSCGRFLPGIIVAALFGIAIYIGSTTELPTIDIKWNVQEDGTVVVPDSNLKTFEMTGMNSVKCYGSSMAFKAKLERVAGVYGVKTFVKHGRVVISYNPDQTTQETIEKAVYVPTKFRIASPDASVKQVKVVTIRTEGMHDRMSPNYLGMRIREAGKQYYGLETQYDCPIIVKLYMGIDEPIDEKFMKEAVNAKVFNMPMHGGAVKEIQTRYNYVNMEKQIDTLDIRTYLEAMFTPWKAEFKKRVEQHQGRPQETLEYSKQSFENPLTSRNLPYLSNHLSNNEGVISVYLRLNEENLPTIGIRYCTDVISAEQILELINQPTWVITYKDDEKKEESARFHFESLGKVSKFEE